MANEKVETPKRPRKFLLHCFYATGHVLPMQAVAKTLVDRGHQVLWLASPDQEARARASGATFVATAAIHRHDQTFQCADPQTLDEIIDVFVDGRLTAQVADFRRVLADFEPDVLLIDALPYGPATLYETKEVKFWATLGVVPMFATEPAPRSTLGQLLKHNEVWAPCLNKQRKELGLGPIEPSGVLHYSPLLHIQASCPSLEYHQAIQPTHYVGPLISPLNKTTLGGGLPSWWGEVATTGRSVVGITQGTFAVDPTSLIIPAVLALKDDPSLLLVVSTPHVDQVLRKLSPPAPLDGDNEDQEQQPAPLPANVRLGSWVPYDTLLALPQTRVLVTNGGYGSVTQALAHGVPLVCAGTTEDKKDTAARVAAVGAGIDLGTDCPSVAQVRAAVGAILSNTGSSGYREGAARTREELTGLGGAERACDLLEAAARGEELAISR